MRLHSPKKHGKKKLATSSVWSRIVLYTLFIGAVCGIIYFLYIYLYQAIAQTKEVEVLQTVVAPATVDPRRFENALEKYAQKKAEFIPIQLDRNPFSGSALLQRTEAEAVTVEAENP